LAEDFTVSKVIVKTYDIDETGEALVLREIRLRNHGDRNVDLNMFKFMEREENTNLVNLEVEDEPKTNFVQITKEVTGLDTVTTIESRKVLSPEEEYKIIVKYDLPEYAERLNGSFLVKEIFQKSMGIEEEADEFHVIYKIPKMFSKYRFWKELCLVASAPSRRYAEENKRILEYRFNLRKGSKYSISIVYWVRTRKALWIILTFVLTSLGGWLFNKIVENIPKLI
jgi:hypothetical protein